MTDTVTLFRVSHAFCYDAIAHATVGQVIAMQGFVNQFGIEFKGTKALAASALSTWAVEYTVGYIVILLFGSPLNDKLGRKWCILLVQLFMLTSTVMSLVATTSGVWGGAKIFQVS